MQEKNTQNNVPAVPADIELKKVEKKKINIKVLVASVLSVVLIGAASYVGLTGKVNLFKGSVLDSYTQESEITVTPLFSEVYVGEQGDVSANKVFFRAEFDLPAEFSPANTLEIGSKNVVIDTFSTGDTDYDVAPLAKEIKGTVSETNTLTQSFSSGGSLELAGPLQAVACIHDLDVDAGETDVPEGKIRQCYKVPDSFLTTDPVSEVAVLNIDNIAADLNGTYSLTVYITSEANNGYAIGTTTFTTVSELPYYYNFSAVSDPIILDEAYNLERNTTLTSDQAAVLSEFPATASYRIESEDGDDDPLMQSISEFVIEGTNTDPITFTSDKFTPGTYDIGLDLDFVVAPDAANENERIFRVEAEELAVEIQAAPTDDPNAFCSSVAVAMTEAFPTNAVVGTRIFQEYTITNSSDTNLTIGLVVDDTDSGFTFYEEDRLTTIVSIQVAAGQNEVIYLSLNPGAAQEYSSAVSFVSRDDISGFSCDPITMNANVTVASSVTPADIQISSCMLRTTDLVYNQTSETVEFEVDAAANRSNVIADFEVRILAEGTSEPIATLNQRNVSLPVIDYNPANGNLDWAPEDSSGTPLPNGNYNANLVVNADGTSSDCTHSITFRLSNTQTTTTNTNNTSDDDESIIQNNSEPLVLLEELIGNQSESIYGSPNFQRNSYYNNYNAAVVTNDGFDDIIPSTVPTAPAQTSTPVTVATTDLGFNQGSKEIAGETGPGALLYPLMMAGSMYVARRRRKR